MRYLIDTKKIIFHDEFHNIAICFCTLIIGGRGTIKLNVVFVMEPRMAREYEEFSEMEGDTCM